MEAGDLGPNDRVQTFKVEDDEYRVTLRGDEGVVEVEGRVRAFGLERLIKRLIECQGHLWLRRGDGDGGRNKKRDAPAGGSGDGAV